MSFVFVSIEQTDKHFEGCELQKYRNSISIVLKSPMKLLRKHLCLLQIFPGLGIDMFDEEPRKTRYSGGRFLHVNLKKTMLSPAQNRKLMIMFGSAFQPAIPPSNQLPYDEDDRHEAVDSN